MSMTPEQDKFVDMYIDGEKMTYISKIIGVSRQTLYMWLKNNEVNAEIEARKEAIKNAAKDKINSHIDSCIDQMLDLAFNCSDKRVKYNAIKYLMDRCLGTPVATKDDEFIGAKKDCENTNELKKELESIKLKVIKGSKNN